MADGPEGPTDWTTYEVARKLDNGEVETPFFDELTVSGAPPVMPIRQMRLVQSKGWPQAAQELTDKNGSKLIAQKSDPIWLLKCKPTCWRLYFYIWEKGKGIVYVHAVCKKQDAENPSDTTAALRIFKQITNGTRSIAPFEFP